MDVNNQANNQVNDQADDEVDNWENPPLPPLPPLPPPPNLQVQGVDFQQAQGVVTANIQKLDGKNFLPWKRQVSIILRLRGLATAIESEEVDEITDMRAILVLLESMDSAHKMQVQAEPTARAIMATLERQYANVSEANKLRMLVKYLKYTKIAGDSINQHVGKLKEMRNALANLNEVHSDEFFQIILINSLPSEYGDFLSQWEMVHPSMKNTEFLVSCLQQKETAYGGPSGGAQVMIVKQKEWKDMTIEERKKVSKCKNCQKKGHWARECPEEAKKDEKKDEKKDVEPPKANIILNSGNLPLGLKSKWILDSGATQHMCNEINWFSEFVKYEKPKVAAVGDGKLIEVLGHGNIDLISFVNGQQVNLTLSDVSYIPELATNLVSVAATAKRGLSTKFDGDLCQICLKGNEIAVGKLGDNALYVLELKSATIAENQTLLAQGNRSMNEWHKVLGHPGPERLSKLIKDDQLGIKATGTLEKCPECPAGKGQLARHPARTSPAALEVGEKVHVDVGFLPNKAKAAYDYYLLCKDEFSCYCFIYFLDKKSCVNTALESLIYHFEYGSGKPIRCIRSDNGSEIKNQMNELLFRKNKIVFENSAPYVPQQNAMIEREMQTVNNIARTLLVQANLPFDLEKEALRTACFLKNRLPTSRSHLTPYELFVGRKPYLLHLEKFGTEVQILDHSHNHAKLDPRTVNAYIVGFTALRNTYRVYVPSYKRTIESCDVFFGPHRKDRTDQDEDSLVDEIRILVEGAAPQVQNVELNSEHDDTDDRSITSGDVTGSDDAYKTAECHQRTSSPARRHRVNNNPYISNIRLDEFFDRFLEENRQAAESEHGHDSEENEYGPEPPPRSSSILAAISIDAPTNYSEAINGPNGPKWKNAIEEELSAHRENGTWQVVDRPASGTKLTAKWIFVVKRNSVGEVERFKARLVARGFEQRQGIDFFEIYAPVARLESIRAVLAIAAIRKLSIIQFDVATAFLHGEIAEEIFVESPQGVEIKRDQCLKLVKALYGLRQAPRAWNSKLNETLIGLGLIPTQSDPCVYMNSKANIILLIYVDDGLLIGPETECLAIVDELNKHFKTKTLSGEMFVGIEIRRNGGNIRLSQNRYIEEVLNRFNISSTKLVTSPTIDVKNLFSQEKVSHVTKAPYREGIGCLLYIANCTRPDILFTVNLLARYNSAPREVHWDAVKHCLYYLKCSKDLCIEYQEGVDEIAAFSDADWAGPLLGRYSTSGVLITMAKGPIIFSSRKQTTLALSSTEAEYISACEAARELVWLNALLSELSFKKGLVELAIDNKSTIKQIENSDTKRRSKHVELKYHYVREKHREKVFRLVHIDTDKQPADLLTKPLSGRKLTQLLESTAILKNRTEMRSSSAKTLILLLMLGSAEISKAFEFQKADALIWRATEHNVHVGTKITRVNFMPLANCDFNNNTDWDSEQDVKREAYSGLKQSCEMDYARDVEPALAAFAECHPGHNHHELARMKREIFTLAVVGGTAYVLTLISTAGYSYWSPNSSYNRLNKVEEREKERDSIIAKMQQDLLSAQHVRNETIMVLDALGKEVGSNRRAIHHIVKIVPSLAMTASDIKQNQMRTKVALEKMTGECKNRHISPKDYTEVLKMNFTDNLKPSDTHLESVTRLKSGLFVIDMYVPIIYSQAKIYRIMPIKHWVNVTTDPQLVQYTGPEYTMVNETNNCIIGVENPEQHSVHVNCLVPNWRDPKLDNWEVIDSSRPDFKELSRPQVIKLATESIIQCLYDEVVIEEKTYDCPHFIFRLPLNVQFELKNMRHEVQTLLYQVAERNIGYETPHLARQGTDPEYGKLIRSLKEKNDASVVSGKFGYEKGTITIPADPWTILTIFSALGGLLSVATFIFRFLRGTQPSAPQPDHINVITTGQCPEQVPFQHYYPVMYDPPKTMYQPYHREVSAQGEVLV